MEDEYDLFNEFGELYDFLNEYTKITDNIYYWEVFRGKWRMRFIAS